MFGKTENEGMFIVISSPSGVGKTTVANMLMQKDSRLQRSISLTTRKPRVGEVDGSDYCFVTMEDFKQKSENGSLLEYAEVFGNFYGTSAQQVREILLNGDDVICTIDWQGALQIQQQVDCIAVFLLPPTLKELKNRLIRRAGEDHNVIRQRLNKAKEEISKYQHYNYVIVNDDIFDCVENVLAIIRVERINRLSKKGLIADKINALHAENAEIL